MPIITKKRIITSGQYEAVWLAFSGAHKETFQDMYKWLNGGAVEWNIGNRGSEATVEGEYYVFDIEQAITLGQGNFHVEGYPLFTNDTTRYMPILVPQCSKMYITEEEKLQLHSSGFTAISQIAEDEKPTDIIGEMKGLCEFVKQTQAVAKDIFASDTTISKPIVFMAPYINPADGEIVLINMKYSADANSVDGTKLEISIVGTQSDLQAPGISGQRIQDDMMQLIKDNSLLDHSSVISEATEPSWKSLAYALLPKEVYYATLKKHYEVKHATNLANKNKNTNSKLSENKIHTMLDNKTWTKGIVAKQVANNYAIFSKGKNKNLKFNGQKVWINDKKYRTIDQFGRLITVESNTFGNGVSVYVRDIGGKIMYKKRMTNVDEVNTKSISISEKKKEIVDLVFRKAQAIKSLESMQNNPTDEQGLPKSYYSTIINNIDAELITNCHLDDVQFKYVNGICNLLNSNIETSSETVGAKVSGALFDGDKEKQHTFIENSLTQTISGLIATSGQSAEELSSFTGGLLKDEQITSLFEVVGDFSQCGSEEIKSSSLNALKDATKEVLQESMAAITSPAQTLKFKTILEVAKDEGEQCKVLDFSTSDKKVLTDKEIELDK